MRRVCPPPEPARKQWQRRSHHIKESIVAFSINTNVASLQAQNYLRTSSDFQSKTINEVTSGLRIVQSGDDARRPGHRQRLPL